MDSEAPCNEKGLVDRAQQGDEGALLSLLDLHDKLVRLRVMELLPDAVRRRVAVSDVMQETRIEAVQGIEGFEYRGEGSFRAWLLGVATNQARKAIRRHLATAKRSRRQEVSKAQRLDTAMHTLDTVTPSQVIMAEELQENIRGALRALPDDYREVLRLCREEQLTIREAALRMGRSREATKKLYGRALTKFAEILKKLQGDVHGGCEVGSRHPGGLAGGSRGGQRRGVRGPRLETS